MLANLPRARELMARDALDALVCVMPKNVLYFSDYDSDWLFDMPWVACVVLPRDETLAPVLVVHDVEVTNLAERPTWIEDLRVYRARVGADALPHYDVAGDVEHNDSDARALALLRRTDASASDSLQAAVRAALVDLGLVSARLGCDDPRFAAWLTEIFPQCSASDALGLVVECRMIKTDEELTRLRAAAERNAAALNETLRAVHADALWAVVKRRYFHAAIDRDCMPVALYVGAGRRSTGLRPDENYRIRQGDQVCFDAMLTHQRYYGDCQRTVVVGAPSAKLQRYWLALRQGAEECYGAMRPGVSTAALREQAIRTIRALGIAGFRHAFVHGLGLDHLEIPRIAGDFGTFTLQRGMVVNMDLEVCELGFGGVYFEQTMLVTEHGAQPLVRNPLELTAVH